MSTVTGPARTAGSAATAARTRLVVASARSWPCTLALCAAIPLAAWAMTRLGAKRTYLTALALITGGSSAATHPGRNPV